MVQFVPCNDGTSPVKCASREEIKEFLSENFFVMLVGDNYIDLQEVKPIEETVT